MKVIEILLEFNERVTVQNYGPALLASVSKDPSLEKLIGFSKMKNPRNKPEHNMEIAVNLFAGADPTPNNQYTQWLIRTYINEWATGRGMKFEDINSTVQQALAKFYKLNKSRLIPQPANDINRYRNFNTFLDVVDRYQDVQQPVAVDKGQAKEIYNDDQVRVIQPLDEKASCYYGQGTRWCTAATKGANYFDDYNSEAPLFIVIPKHPTHPGEKYQLHFTYKVNGELVTSEERWEELRLDDDGEMNEPDGVEYGQYMDEKDDPLQLEEIKVRFGQSFRNFMAVIRKQYPELRLAIDTDYNF